MLEHLERQTSLTNNQRKIVFAAILGDMLDFFDFYLIGFVLAFIVGSWHLTYGQSAMILLSSGLGAVPGALFWGWLADRIGRRKVFIMTALNFSLATGVMALTPEQGGWIFLTVFRFLVGFGVSGSVRGGSAAGAGIRADGEARPGRAASSRRACRSAACWVRSLAPIWRRWLDGAGCSLSG